MDIYIIPAKNLFNKYSFDKLAQQQPGVAQQPGMWQNFKNWGKGVGQAIMGNPQPPNIQQISDKLQAAWTSWVKLVQDQISTIGPLQRGIVYLINEAKKSSASGVLTTKPQILSQINSLIQTLTKAAADENQDSQFIKQVSVQVQNLAREMGTKGRKKPQPAAAPAATGQPTAAPTAVAPEFFNQRGTFSTFSTASINAEMGSSKNLRKYF